jgi:hypothetical protein
MVTAKKSPEPPVKLAQSNSVAKTGSTPAVKKPALKAKPKQPLSPTGGTRKPSTAPRAKPVVNTTHADKQAKKPKLVRDSFTIPKTEYAVLSELKHRLNILSKPAKKSELLRAGIKLLVSLNDSELVTALAAVPTVKTGRPNKSTSVG